MELTDCDFYYTATRSDLSTYCSPPQIPPLRSLRRLVVSDCSFDSRQQRHLAKAVPLFLFDLRWLGFSALPVLQSLTLFSGFASIRHGSRSTDTTAFLGALTSLASLSLSGSNITDANAKFIFSKMHLLRVLDISGCPYLTQRALSWLPPVLDKLDISRTNILQCKNRNLEPEPAFPNSGKCTGLVTALTLSTVPCDFFFFRQFYMAESVEELDVSGAGYFDFGGDSRISLAQFISQAKNLVRLDLGLQDLSWNASSMVYRLYLADFSLLVSVAAQLETLRELDVSNTTFSNEDAKCLSQGPVRHSLRYLGVWRCWNLEYDPPIGLTCSLSRDSLLKCWRITRKRSGFTSFCDVCDHARRYADVRPQPSELFDSCFVDWFE